jgi:hypothetical protein
MSLDRGCAILLVHEITNERGCSIGVRRQGGEIPPFAKGTPSGKICAIGLDGIFAAASFVSQIFFEFIQKQIILVSQKPPLKKSFPPSGGI